MGADLYIKSIYRYDAEQRKFVGSETEGYFRDSYNVTSLLGTFDLSWWISIGPHLDDGGYLQVEDIRWFKQTVLETTQEFPSREELEEDGAHIEDSGESSLEGWHTYYRNKRERLLAFLDRALERNEPIYCSI
jgi:hypothetical protein